MQVMSSGFLPGIQNLLNFGENEVLKEASPENRKERQQRIERVLFRAKNHARRHRSTGGHGEGMR